MGKVATAQILPIIRHDRVLAVAAAPVARKIEQRAGLGACGHVVQRRDLLLARLVIDHGVLILVRRGEKVLRQGDSETVLGPGDAVAIGGGTVYDVINRPEANGIYEASWLMVAPALIDRFAAARTTPAIADPLALRGMPGEFQASFDRATASITARDLPDGIAAQRLLEMLAWIEHKGFHLATRRAPTVTHRLRALLSAAPARDWAATDIAGALGMSEATLRRRLAAEDTSLTAQLTDLRMSLALTLLQVTDKPVGEIAHEVGYESASRFATRFRARLGVSPTTIRTAD